MNIYGVEVKENKVYKVTFVNYETCEIDECVCKGKEIIETVEGGKIVCASTADCINAIVAKRAVKQYYVEFADIIDVEEYEFVSTSCYEDY